MGVVVRSARSCVTGDSGGLWRVACAGMSASELATLAIEHADALCRAAVSALREVEDESDDDDDDDDDDFNDFGEVSVDGFAVDIEDAEADAVDRDAKLEVDRRRAGCAAAAFHLLAARLGGVAVSKKHLEDQRERWGEDALLVALSGAADALSRTGRVLTDAEIVAVHRARADARQLLQNPQEFAGLVGLPGLQEVDDVVGEVDSAGSRQVARALDAAVSEANLDDDNHREHFDLSAAVAVSTLPVAAMLRVRAGSAAAARALPGAARISVVTTSLESLSSSPDELLFAARGEPVDAVAALLRAATSIAHGLPEGAPLALSLISTRGDLIEDVVASAELMPMLFGDGGRLALDEQAFALAGDLAELPGSPFIVDPRAPWGQERWELSALLSRSAFRGRDDDVAVCQAVLSAGGTAARLLVLGGPAGIGKSSLVRAALREAGLFDDVAAVAWGAADTQQQTPYAAVVGMLRALARAPEGHPRAGVRIGTLVTGLAEFLTDSGERAELTALVDVVRDVVGAVTVTVVDAHDDDLGERRGPRALRTSLRRAVLLLAKALIARAGDGRPLVFVVSGAEAMDVPTRDVLQFVARQLGERVRVVLLLASSKSKLPAGFEDGFEVTRKEVKPLDDVAGLAIARGLLDLNELVDSADLDLDQRDLLRCLQTLVERAKGSPLFVAHAVRWAVEGGYVNRAGFAGGWSATRFDVVGHRLPTRVDKLLAARVLRLPAAARHVLGHCAALGSTFLPAAVEFVGTHLGLTVDEVNQAVRLLTETGFLARSQRRPGAPIFVDDSDNDGSDDSLLAFEHPLLRAAAEQALSDDENKAVHGVVADALEALMDTAAIAPRLARHHKLAERRRQAVHHLVVAVRRARRLDDRQGAVSMANEALELVAHDQKDVIFTLQLELAAVLESGASSGDKQHKALKDALKQLVRAADKTGDPRRQALAYARVARFNLFLGDVDKAEEAVLRALARARDMDVAHVAEAVRNKGIRDVLRLLALIRFAARDVDGARRSLEEARKLTPVSDRRVLGGLEHQAGLFRLESNDPLGALEHLLVAFMHKRATADLDGEAACLDAIADVYVRCGHLWTALSLLVRTIAVRAAIGDDVGTAWSIKNRAQVLLMAGDVHAAVAEATRARGLGKTLGLDRLEHQAVLVLARAELAREDPVAAEAILDGMRRRIDDKRDPFSAMEGELLSARAKWLRAQTATGGARDRLLKTALGRARAAVDLGERRGLLSGQVLGNALLGDVLLSSGDAGSALPYAQRAAELIDDRTATGLSVEEVFAPYMRALQALGDDDEANAVRARARGLLQERAQRLPTTQQEQFWAVPARRAFLTPS